jgi:uncharacterized repeat protein (TIGR01451 family)
MSSDIGVTKLTNSDTVLVGSDATFSIVVNNAGPDAANNATLNDTLPGNMTFVSLSVPAGWTCPTLPSVGSGGTITCNKPSLAFNASDTFTLVGHIPSGTPSGTTYENTATVSTTTQEFNPDNNSSSASITVDTCFTAPTVTTTADSGPGSLRQAILDACPGAIITFDNGVVSPITLTSGALVIDKNLTIEGPGANQLTVQRSSAAGTPNFRIFTINSGKTATISGLTISNGKAVGVSASDLGGAILNDHGTLTIDACTISNNSAGFAGGIYNNGSGAGTATLAITNSTLSSNAGTTSGGGIFNQGTNGSAILNISNSTISGNNSGSGAGLIAESGGTSSSTVTLINVTITNNTSSSGGGIYIFDNSGSNTIRLKNTIVAGNVTSSGGPASDIFGTVDGANSSNNLIGTGGSGGLVNGTNSNKVNVADPRLGPLANNGGPTRTHSLLAGSPALDSGSNANLPADTLDFDGDSDTGEPIPFDQRGAGFARQRDAGSDSDTTQTVDIGALEADPSIEDISDKSTLEDTPLIVNFNVGDSSNGFDSITATSSNQTLVPNANIQLTGSGSVRTLTITPAADLSGTTTITVTVTKTIGGTTLSMSDSFLVTVNAVNDAPVNTVPGAQSVIENGSLTFSSANSNRISIADIDAGSSPVQVQLAATNGTMTLNGTAGLTFTPANANNDGVIDSTLTFTGTIANINAALNGMTFNPTAGFDGPTSIQIVTNDQGNTGSGGPKSDTDTVSITVRDGGALAFSSATYTVAEGGGSATITVNRSGGTAGEARVQYATGVGTASPNFDFTSTSGQLIFADGVTSQTFSVAITNDTLDEADETINLSLANVSGSGAIGTPFTAVLTITDDDAAPSLSINDVTLNEGNSGTTSFTFTVSLSAASGQTVTVNYATANGTATAPSDYTAIASTLLTFNAGETTKNVTVLVNGDIVSEADENFFVNLSGASNASISDNQGLGTILNDDTPAVQFSSPTYSVGEAGSHAAITVIRTGDSSIPMTVNYASSDASGLNTCSQVTGNASQRCDYATVVGILRFAAGENSKDIIVPIIDDVHIEGSEIFTMTLSGPVGGNLGSNTSAVVTITDNDTGAGTNPIDNDAFFIRQLYIDLLGRLPEPGAVSSWLAVLNHCSNPTDPVNGCDRIAVAQGFMGSLEFQGRGYFVYRHYSALLGRIPLYGEFTPDMALVNGFLSSTDLEANKMAYTDIVMNRPEFKSIYDPTINNPTAFVDKLIEKAGLTSHSQRSAWISGLTNSTLTRAQVVRQFIDSPEVSNKFVREAFVIMNYFGFLRRTADASYQAWINLLNQTNDPRVVIGGFINSPEYRLRFGP